MTRELIIRREAEVEIAAARDRYDERRVGLGAEFVHAVDSTLAAILQNPFQYQAAWGRFRRAGFTASPTV